MFTHLYQRQYFKEAEVRVYGGEIVLALEHLHKVGEDLAPGCCHGTGDRPTNRAFSRFPGFSSVWQGLLFWCLLQGAFLLQELGVACTELPQMETSGLCSQGLQTGLFTQILGDLATCLLGPPSLLYLQWPFLSTRPASLGPSAGR
jgi:hypothetical protein